eukprot:TCALIF_11420-PA protein Name:"Protein of unknown function" AED:0.62 eAED:0.62 QI:0/0/0/0.25/1/1/4/0/186
MSECPGVAGGKEHLVHGNESLGIEFSSGAVLEKSLVPFTNSVLVVPTKKAASFDIFMLHQTHKLETGPVEKNSELKFSLEEEEEEEENEQEEKRDGHSLCASLFLPPNETSLALMGTQRCSTYFVMARHHLKWLLVPTPILQHLRRRFDKVAFHVQTLESSGAGLGAQAMHQVTKFVEVGDDFSVI